MPRLVDMLTPCGPVVDEAAAARVREDLAGAAQAGGWSEILARCWTALAPVFAASPYLASLARRAPERLRTALARPPQTSLDVILAATALVRDGADEPAARRELRRLKAELHLLTALCDLGGVWSLDQVTAALTRFADLAVQAALAVAARGEQARGRVVGPARQAGEGEGPVSGLFVLALGKHGGFELNYSSDIDISVFYAPEALPTAAGVERGAAAVKLTQAMSALLQARTEDGYVFRVDLRLRPDPASTPVAMPADAALDYYESAGQNWERAAMIKARACAGDVARAQAFIAALQPFIWRRTLDYAAIADIHAIKRQIHVHKVDERLSAPGANLKLGAGGIREIEFFVQTQQLILGGRDPALRTRRTLEALAALTRAGHVAPQACDELSAAYERLRRLEHRAQMIADEQTHVLPQDDRARASIAALDGYGDLGRFDSSVSTLLAGVNARYAALFADDEPLSSRFGSLVFTGVEDDPQTVATLQRMGFSQPGQVLAIIRGWHHGRIPATRTERGRELFTRLAPRLLEAAHAAGSPDVAFNRFADFFARLSGGVQVQSLFLAQPRLFELVVQVMAFAPELAATLARQPGALDAMLDARFFAPLQASDVTEATSAAVRQAVSFEDAMDAVRVAHREQAFRIGVQVMTGAAHAQAAGRAFAALADACIGALAPVALAEAERLGGAFPGQVAVVALGKAGSREMTIGSDLDLMMLYKADSGDAVSAARGWSAETFYARFSQRLVTALSAPTAQGELYEVDLRLRPSGKAGPVAVSLAAFTAYHEAEAQTWEALALTRARVVWASTPAFAQRAAATLQRALRRPRDAATTAREVLEMRALMMRERPPSGAWDLKLREGGLVDIEFTAEHLQIVHAGAGGPLDPNTGASLAALGHAGLVDADDLGALSAAWRWQQDVQQVLKLALAEGADLSGEPPRFKALLARAGGADSFEALKADLERITARAHGAFQRVVSASLAGEAADN